jgi:protein-disulfide isomerase
MSMRARGRTGAALAALLAATAACAEAPASGAPATDATTRELLATAREAPAPADPQNLDLAVLGWTTGSGDSPVRVVEFSDYGCGYCRRFHQETWPVLVKDFVGAGKVEWKFLPYVSGMFRNSPAATLAAECVLEQGDDLFERMNSGVWDRQAAWKSAGDPKPILRELAEASGADLVRWDSCVSQNRRTPRVDAATALAQQLGVRGTPTFFIVGYPPIQGALPTETFHQILSTAYAQSTGGRGG